jgi:aryl-alcohol dehydrogenase-like predicted oxidoreductase
VLVSELLAGRATAEGTERFARRFAALPGHFRAPDRLALSSIGLGTRPGSGDGSDDLLYRSAVPLALERGINVFDTALAFRAQRSERALGAALRRAIGEGRAQRDEVYVVSKAGYLASDPDLAGTASEARRYLTETYVRSGLVNPDELVEGTHCFDPPFLRDQIERSRRNLGLETLDLYCLHDPEVQLLAKGPERFRRVLAAAFEALEGAVADGRIGAYGLATWSGLLVPYVERGHLSVIELFELALAVGGPAHHLRGVQLPYGLALADGYGGASQLGPEASAAPVLEILRDTGTAVFAVAPLARGRLTRALSRAVREALPGLRTDAQRAIQLARSTPGVTTALVGMRDPAHVEENASTAAVPPASAEAVRDLIAGLEARA